MPHVTAGMDEALPVTALLLAGGEGRRMGGQDKGWLELAGQPLVRHAITRLLPQVHRLLISANRNIGCYEALGFPVLADAAPWIGMGPVAALATLAPTITSTNGYVQLAPCDMPLLPADLVERLEAALQEDARLEMVYPVCVDASQPALLLAKCAALADAADYLAAGQRSLRGWIARHASRGVVFDNAMAFANANDPAALRQLEQVISHDA